MLKALKNSNKFSTYLYLSSDHYDAKFGNTYKFIDKKFNIISNKRKNLSKQKVKNFIKDILSLENKIKKIKPDFIIILGDRYEMLLGPITSIQKESLCFIFMGDL